MFKQSLFSKIFFVIGIATTSMQSISYAMETPRKADQENVLRHDFAVLVDEKDHVRTDEKKSAVLVSPENSETKKPNAATFDDIAQHVLRAFPLQEQPTLTDVITGDSSENKDADSNTEFDPETMYQFLTKEVIAPQEFHKKNRAHKILAAAEKKEPISWDPIIDERTWTELNLLYGNQDHPTTALGHILTNNRTNTELGKAYFNGLIARPTDDTKILETRQTIIQELGKVHDNLDEALQRFSDHESMFTGIWGKEQLMQFMQNGKYFSTVAQSKRFPRITKCLNALGNRLNRSALALDVKEAVGEVEGVLGLTMGTLSPIAFLTFGVCSLSYYFDVPAWAAEYTDYWMPSVGMLAGLAFLITNRATQGLTASTAGIYQFSKLPRTWKEFVVSFKYVDFLRKRLAHIAQSLKIMRELRMIVPDPIKKQLTYFKYIEQLFDVLPQQNADLADFIKNLNTNTFSPKGLDDDSTTVFFRRGRMLRVYRMLDRIKPLFEPALAAIGELDAFLTVTKLLKESDDKHATFSLVQYKKDAKTPSIDLKDFWNPFLDQKTVVTNCVAMGVDYKVPHMIITGPNSGGKSTITKSILLAVAVLGQSICIVPAKGALFTPFSHASIYANIGDSIVNRESRFQREGKQAFAHGDKIAQFAALGKFSLAEFDEIFSGTSPTEGAKWGYLTARGFADYPNCIVIVATHFHELTELEKDTGGNFVNFKVSVEENPNRTFKLDGQNKLIRKYKLERGVSDQHIAADVLREQGETSQFFRDKILGRIKA